MKKSNLVKATILAVWTVLAAVTVLFTSDARATGQAEKAAEWTKKLAEFDQAAVARKTADKMRIP